jgi:hypothetical protein
MGEPEAHEQLSHKKVCHPLVPKLSLGTQIGAKLGFADGARCDPYKCTATTKLFILYG